MKLGVFIKAFIVIIAVSVLGYIIYQNNQAAEVTDLVRNPIEKYDFALYVDSICQEISESNDIRAKQLYDSLYEEITVYSKITINKGEAFISDSLIELSYEDAIEAYWPIFRNKANSYFQRGDWDRSSRNELRTDIKHLKTCLGINKMQKDSLEKYNSYINGYSNFSNLLKSLEGCKNAETYKKHSNLFKYEQYPYNNLTELQQRSDNAKDNAKKHWCNYLKKRGDDIKKKGEGMLNWQLNMDDVRDFYNLKENWINDVSSYEQMTYEDNIFLSLENELEGLYRQLADRYNTQNQNSY